VDCGAKVQPQPLCITLPSQAHDVPVGFDKVLESGPVRSRLSVETP